MKKIFISLFILIVSNACINNKQQNEKEVNKLNFPIGNKMVSQSGFDINKITIDSFKIEYFKFYDNITTSIKDTIKITEFEFSNSYYFSKEEVVFFNSLNHNNPICCMELIAQNNVNFKIYLIKTQSDNLEISEGHGYKSELFLVSVSKNNNKIIDIINIYNDGIMLYWECVRFFYIDADLNIYLKDYSINEGEYRCVNYQVFNFTSQGYFKRNDILSKKESIVTDSISNFKWNGIYTFNQIFLRSMDEFKLEYSIKIINEQSASLINKVNDRTQQYSGNIVSFNNDSLVINYFNKSNDPQEIILYKNKKDYEIGGLTIYLLNPPNDRYSVVKE